MASVTFKMGNLCHSTVSHNFVDNKKSLKDLYCLTRFVGHLMAYFFKKVQNLFISPGQDIDILVHPKDNQKI